MTPHCEDTLIEERINKIQTLAALALYGDDVEFAIQLVVTEAHRDYVVINKDNPHINLWMFKDRLNQIAHLTHPSLPDYRKTLQYAASLIVLR